MPRLVQRSEILDYVTYGERRPALQASAMAAKALRRVHLGPHLTFLFENAETIRYQIQEMVRVEKMVKEADIQHEVDTYNAVLGAEGELGCTLLIEIEEADRRTELLTRWRELPFHLLMTFADGSESLALWDETQNTEAKLSSVQFLRFPVGGRIPSGLRVTLPGLAGEERFGPETAAALQADLRA